MEGPRWLEEHHGFDSLPLLVRPGTVLPIGARTDRPDYAWADGVTLRCFELPDGFDGTVTVPGGTGSPASFRVRRDDGVITATTDDAPGAWALEAGGREVRGSGPGELSLTLRVLDGVRVQA